MARVRRDAELHPQWAGYTYTWWHERDVVHPARLERGEGYEQDLRNSPFPSLIAAARDAAGARGLPLRLRRRLAGHQAQRDFPVLEEFASAGATNYVAELIPFGRVREAFPESGIGFSLATDRPEGFDEDDLRVSEAALPALSLAIMSVAERTIAAGLFAAYLGGDAGRRVSAGVVGRGLVESIRAVLWYADIRGFTAIADTTSSPVLVDLLNDIFETLTAALRRHGGQVLKFLGDGMLASFAFVDATRQQTCRHALDIAAEPMRGLDRLNAARSQAGKQVVAVDLALHLGGVLSQPNLSKGRQARRACGFWVGSGNLSAGRTYSVTAEVAQDHGRFEEQRMIKAIWNGKVVAETDRTEIVEGNHYFPRDALRAEYFRSSDTHTTCPWKGTAHYYTSTSMVKRMPMRLGTTPARRRRRNISPAASPSGRGCGSRPEGAAAGAPEMHGQPR